MDGFDDVLRLKPWWRELRGLPELPPRRSYTLAEARAEIDSALMGFVLRASANVNREYKMKWGGLDRINSYDVVDPDGTMTGTTVSF